MGNEEGNKICLDDNLLTSRHRKYQTFKNGLNNLVEFENNNLYGLYGYYIVWFPIKLVGFGDTMRRETTGYPCVEKSLWSRSFMEHCCLSRLYMIRYFCLVIQLRINIHEFIVFNYSVAYLRCIRHCYIVDESGHFVPRELRRVLPLGGVCWTSTSSGVTDSDMAWMMERPIAFARGGGTALPTWKKRNLFNPGTENN